MNTDLEQEVESRLWDHQFDELRGAVAPPDRTHEILRRVAKKTRSRRTPPRRTGLRSRPLAAAALLLLGLSATIGVAILQRGGGTPIDPAAGEQIFAHPVAIHAMPTDPDAIDAPAPPAANQAMSAPEQPVVSPPDHAPPLPVTARNRDDAAKGDAAKTEVAHQKGTDPADLAAVRSAEAMLAAEKKLTAKLRAGAIPGVDKLLAFDSLSDWTYTDGLEGAPESVRALDGDRLMLIGFMLPIDEVKDIKEFLLVQSLWSCCYGVPPDIHGIVRCVMPKDKTTDYSFEPLAVIGTFKVEATILDGYVVDIFQLHIESVEPIK